MKAKPKSPIPIDVWFARQDRAVEATYKRRRRVERVAKETSPIISPAQPAKTPPLTESEKEMSRVMNIHRCGKKMLAILDDIGPWIMDQYLDGDLDPGDHKLEVRETLDHGKLVRRLFVDGEIFGAGSSRIEWRSEAEA
jgi:hypothetical protein